MINIVKEIEQKMDKGDDRKEDIPQRLRIFFKKNQMDILELKKKKKAKSKIKSSMTRFSSRWDISIARIGELEDRPIEHIQIETERTKNQGVKSW